MTQPIHFDEAEISAAIDRMIEQEKHRAEEPAEIGAQVRAHAQVMKPIFLYMSGEINRGTEIKDIMLALASSFSDAVTSMADTCGQSDPISKAAFCNRVSLQIASCISQNIRGGAYLSGHATVVGLRGGRA